MIIVIKNGKFILSEKNRLSIFFSIRATEIQIRVTTWNG